MGRPQTNKVSWFPHPVTHGKKMSYMEKKYGNNGYAVWFKILEELGNTDYHYLDLSDEVQIMFLSDRCLVSEEVLLSMINDLIRLKEFDKTLWEENQILFSEKFLESVQEAYKKRSNDCITKKGLLELLDSLGVRKLGKSTPKTYLGENNPPVNPQSREDKNREDKNREEERESEERENDDLADAKTEPLKYDEIKNYFNSLCYKIPKIREMTDSRKRATKKIVEKYGKESLAEVFKLSAESAFMNGDNSNGWVASFDWLLKPKNFVKVMEGNYKNKGSSADRKLDQAKSRYLKNLDYTALLND